MTVAAVLAAAFLYPAPAAAEPDGWGVRADAAIERALALDDGVGSPFYDAYLADAIARRSAQGWDDPRARLYLDRVMAARLPDGGWGLGYAWDAFQDGTVNPATTTYTITLTDHVGPVLLEAYKAGVVPASVIISLRDRLYAIPKITVTPGYCIAYSSSPNDAKPGLCVHNINASVARFLRLIQDAGFPTSQLWITRITMYEAATYLPNDRNWLYMNGRTHLNDLSHNAVDIDAMMVVAPGVGVDALLWHMSRPAPVATDPYAWHLKAVLAPWACDLAAQWLTEFDAGVSQPAAQTFGLQAQAARMAARAADACDQPAGPSPTPSPTSPPEPSATPGPTPPDPTPTGTEGAA